MINSLRLAPDSHRGLSGRISERGSGSVEQNEGAVPFKQTDLFYFLGNVAFPYIAIILVGSTLS